jgi:hypothetical protein
MDLIVPRLLAFHRHWNRTDNLRRSGEPAEDVIVPAGEITKYTLFLILKPFARVLLLSKIEITVFPKEIQSSSWR